MLTPALVALVAPVILTPALLALAAPLPGPPLGDPALPDPRAPVARPAVVRPFDPPPEPWAAGHRGVDLAVAAGAPVRSLTSGVVGFAGQVGGTPVVTVRIGGARRVTYEPVRPAVQVGEAVARGQLLGWATPSGGHCGGAGCVHVGLRDGEAYRDPAVLLGRAVLLGTAVLKPLRRRAPGPPGGAGG